MISNVFLFARQVMADGDRCACASQAWCLSGSKHIGQWLLSKVLASGCFHRQKHTKFVRDMIAAGPFALDRG